MAVGGGGWGGGSPYYGNWYRGGWGNSGSFWGGFGVEALTSRFGFGMGSTDTAMDSRLRLLVDGRVQLSANLGVSNFAGWEWALWRAVGHTVDTLTRITRR